MGQKQNQKIYYQQSDTSIQQRKHVQLQNWVTLQTPQFNQLSQMGNYVILKNQVTGQTSQVYSLHFQNGKDFETYILQFDQWRCNKKPFIVQSKYIIIENEESVIEKFCACKNVYIVKIFIESTVVRLQQIKDIPISQSLYILLSCLNGFQYLFNIFGYFSIKQSMIAIDENGNVKVWMNPNFSQNRPYIEGSKIWPSNKKQAQSLFIRHLIQLIDRNTDYEGKQNTFRNFMQQKLYKYKGLTFLKCKQFLLNYAEQNEIDLPNSLISILDILFEKTNKTTISHQNFSNRQEHILYGKNYKNQYLLAGQDDQRLLGEEVYKNQLNMGGSSRPGSLAQNQNQSSSSQIQYLNQIKKKNSQIKMQMLKANIKSQNLAAKNLNSPPKSPKKQNSYQERFQSQQFYDSQLQKNNHTSSMPRMKFTYTTYQKQESYQMPIIANQYQLLNDLQNPHQQFIQNDAHYQKQSTIREEAQQDSFFTSYRNSKFQTSRARRSNYLDQKNKHNLNAKLNSNHQHTFSSNSDSKLTSNKEDQLSKPRFSKEQQNVRKENANREIYNQKNNQFYIQCQSEKMNNNYQSARDSCEIPSDSRSRRSIRFHTLTEIKQIDSEIARDLEQMMRQKGTSIKV